ncbi:MAG: hypothetical protein Q9227_008574 [Pyrenula ochraceoflavens]
MASDVEMHDVSDSLSELSSVPSNAPDVLGEIPSLEFIFQPSRSPNPSGLERLPIELLENIACQVSHDRDLISLALASKYTAAAILPNCLGVWRHRFLALYDYPMLNNKWEFWPAYQIRQLVMKALVDFGRGGVGDKKARERERECLDVIREMIMASSNAKHSNWFPKIFADIPALKPTIPDLYFKNPGKNKLLGPITFFRGIVPFISIDSSGIDTSAKPNNQMKISDMDRIFSMGYLFPSLSAVDFANLDSSFYGGLRVRGLAHKLALSPSPDTTKAESEGEAEDELINLFTRIVFVLYKPTDLHILLETDCWRYAQKVKSFAKTGAQQAGDAYHSGRPPPLNEGSGLRDHGALPDRDHIIDLEDTYLDEQERSLKWKDIEYAYAYEGVVIPGGEIMMGRWWKCFQQDKRVHTPTEMEDNGDESEDDVWEHLDEENEEEVGEEAPGEGNLANAAENSMSLSRMVDLLNEERVFIQGLLDKVLSADISIKLDGISISVPKELRASFETSKDAVKGLADNIVPQLIPQGKTWSIVLRCLSEYIDFLEQAVEQPGPRHRKRRGRELLDEIKGVTRDAANRATKTAETVHAIMSAWMEKNAPVERSKGKASGDTGPFVFWVDN